MNINFSRWMTFLLILFLIGLAAAIFSLYSVIFRYPIMFAGLFIILFSFSSAPILLDLYFHKLKLDLNIHNAEERDRKYYPNLQLWGIGPLLGIIVVVLFLIGNTTSTLINNAIIAASPSGAPNIGPLSTVVLTLIQNLTILITFVFLLVFLIWALIKQYRTE